MTDDQQRAREFMPEPRILWVHGTPAKCVTGFTEQQMLAAITAALRAAPEAVALRVVPEGWRIRKDGAGIVVTALDGIPGGMTVKATGKSLQERILYALCNALLAARPQGVK